MLPPNYLYNVADRIIEIYEELNQFAVNDICRRIVTADWQMTPTARHQIRKMQLAGQHMQQIQEWIASITERSENEVKALFETSAIRSLQYSKALYEKTGLKITGLFGSPQMIQILQAGYAQTNRLLKNFTQTTAEASQRLLLETLDRVFMQVITGQRDYISAIEKAVDTVSANGIWITYPTGARSSIEAGVRRAVVTGINQTCGELEIQRVTETGSDLVVTSQHFGARPSHEEWQGEIFSLSGKDKRYREFYSATGYGTGDGLCGWNCRHSFGAFVEGVSKIPEKINTEKSNEIYYKQQKQRALERKIRNNKRRLQGLQSSMENTDDTALKQRLQPLYQREAVKLKNAEKNYKKYCSDNKLRTQNERLQIADWSRSQAMKAVYASKNSLTSVSNNGKIKTGSDVMQLEYQRYGRNKTTLVNKTYIESGEYRRKFDNATDNPAVNKMLYDKSKEALKHRSGTVFEDMYWIDSESGKLLLEVTDSTIERAIV